jgi:hypothetical protein
MTLVVIAIILMESTMTPKRFYEFWGLTVPEQATSVCLLVCVLFVVVVCAHKRERAFLPPVVLYALAFAVAYIFLFSDLGFEAFD